MLPTLRCFRVGSPAPPAVLARGYPHLSARLTPYPTPSPSGSEPPSAASVELGRAGSPSSQLRPSHPSRLGHGSTCGLGQTCLFVFEVSRLRV